MGAVVGGAVACFVSIEGMAILGLGALIAVGPVVAAFAGAGAGGALGWIVGWLTGLPLSE